MPQTIIAILTLALAGLFAINQQRSVRHAREAMLNDEFELMASGVALQVMEYIGSRPYDQATVSGVIMDPNLLTATFPSGRRCDVLPPIQTTSPYQACNSLSDYNDMQWERIPFEIQTDTVWFEASATVQYVTNAQQPSATRTFNKRVTVKVRPATVGGPTVRMGEVGLPRVFSYGAN